MQFSAILAIYTFAILVLWYILYVSKCNSFKICILKIFISIIKTFYIIHKYLILRHFYIGNFEIPKYRTFYISLFQILISPNSK